MSEKDGELMHLTAESTSKESRSLVTETASRLPDGEIKIDKKDTTRHPSDRDLDKERKWKRWAEEEMASATHVLSTSFEMTDGKHN